MVENAGGKTLVTNAGSNGKFLGVLDFDVNGGKVSDFRYRLLPVFANLLAPDAEMEALITKTRAPFESKLGEKLAVSEGLLYRRGNFNGSFDQVILDALIAEKDAEIAFSPGFRWGTTILPGEADHHGERARPDRDHLSLCHAATHMNGAQIKQVLEDVCDNLFNADPYYQQGGDMVRVGGMSYSCDPDRRHGRPHRRHGPERQADRRDKTYKVAGWAAVSEAAREKGGEPIWDLVARHLRAKKTIPAPTLNLPRLKNVEGNPGMAA